MVFGVFLDLRVPVYIRGRVTVTGRVRPRQSLRKRGVSTCAQETRTGLGANPDEVYQGLKLPRDVLEKIYFKNAERILKLKLKLDK